MIGGERSDGHKAIHHLREDQGVRCPGVQGSDGNLVEVVKLAHHAHGGRGVERGGKREGDLLTVGLRPDQHLAGSHLLNLPAKGSLQRVTERKARIVRIPFDASQEVALVVGADGHAATLRLSSAVSMVSVFRGVSRSLAPSFFERGGGFLDSQTRASVRVAVPPGMMNPRAFMAKI